MDEDEKKKLNRIRNKLIIMVVVIVVVLFITTHVFVIDFICMFLFNIFLVIMLIALILFIWLLYRSRKLKEDLESIPEDQREQRLMEYPDMSLLYILEKKIVERFKKGGEERDIPVEKIVLDTDGIHLFRDQDNECRFVKWGDIWFVAFRANKEYGDIFTFRMINKDFFGLSSEHAKEQNEDLNKMIHQNLSNFRKGNAITWNVISGDYHMIYIEKKANQ